MIELVDTSVWGWRERDPEVKRLLDEKLEEDTVGTCDAVRLELLYSARHVAEFRDVRRELDALHTFPIGAPEWTRALDVYEELAARGGSHQRQVKHMDLLIAAAAESAGVAVLHCDADYDRIADVTGQPTHWAMDPSRHGQPRA